MRPLSLSAWVLLTALALGAQGPANAQPFASQVTVYTPGTGVTPGFDNPLNALGMPSLNNGTSEIGGEIFDNGDVTPFNGAFTTDQLVQVGDGGGLVVRFDDPVLNDASNPYGVDLLVFGNAFFFQPTTFAPIADDIFADDALISVSQDGVTWTDIGNVFADGVFPTSAFVDTPGPFDSGGTTQSDFTLPVDPSIDWLGKGFEELVALYAGSGGGAGVDLSETNLDWIQYVRITARDGVTAEIDAFADVTALPEPPSLILLVLALAYAAQLAARDEMPTPRRPRRIMC